MRAPPYRRRPRPDPRAARDGAYFADLVAEKRRLETLLRDPTLNEEEAACYAAELEKLERAS